MSTNYTPLLTSTEASADEFNSRFQDLDDAIEDVKDGTAALSAPDITSFTNAQHDHSNAANGGQIPFDSLDTTGATDGQLWVADGAGSGAWENLFVPEGYVRGMNVFQFYDGASVDKLIVAPGTAVVDGKASNHNSSYFLSPSTDADWVSGASNEAADRDILAYVNGDGDVKLHHVKPNYPSPLTASRVATMQVNESGWVGASGFGLGETTITYDNDTGEATIVAGMLLGVYTDSGYTTGRGKGSGAGGNVNYMTFVVITDIDTGTNELTVESNNIAFNDDDYLIVIERGSPLYLYYSSEWWRLLGGLRNGSSGRLTDTQVLGSNEYTCDEGTDYTTASTSFVAVDSTNLVLTLTTLGGDVEIGFFGNGKNATAQWSYYDVYIDSLGDRVGGDDGITGVSGTTLMPVSFNKIVKGLPPGTHTFTLQWRTQTGYSLTMYNGASAGAAYHPQFWVREVQR